jgi:hypothetical protein
MCLHRACQVQSIWEQVATIGVERASGGQTDISKRPQRASPGGAGAVAFGALTRMDVKRLRIGVQIVWPKGEPIFSPKRVGAALGSAIGSENFAASTPIVRSLRHFGGLLREHAGNSLFRFGHEGRTEAVKPTCQLYLPLQPHVHFCTFMRNRALAPAFEHGTLAGRE